MVPGLHPTVVQERYFHFDPEVLEHIGSVYLSGYWQSYRYFDNIASILRREFSVRSRQMGDNLAMAQLIASTQSVSLHVRRGDYVSCSLAMRRHGVCPLEYYDAAIRIMADRMNSPHFFIFSDDIPWVQTHIQLQYPCTYVTHNGVANDYEDLRLMSQCKSHIIANSTFGWWGAWLSQAPEKIVIAPRSWFAGLDYNTGDLIPSSWLRL